MTTRKRWDTNALRSSVSAPGTDTRVWLELGVVQERGVDPLHGVFADVYVVPNGPKYTCYAGQPYAGDQFGSHFPFKVNDTVVIGIPHGDSGFGPIILGRFWSAGRRPPLDVIDTTDPTEPTDDIVIRVEPGQKIKIVTTGVGNIELTVEGQGAVVLGTPPEAALPLAMAHLVETLVHAAIAGHTHVCAAPGNPSGPGVEAGPSLTMPTSATFVKGG